MLAGILVDEPIEVGCQLAGHFGWATGAGTVPQTLAPLVGEAMDPLAQRGIGKVQRVGHCLEAVSLDDFTHSLGPAEDTGLLRLLQEVLQGGEGVIRKVEFKGPHSGGLQEKLLQKLPDSPWLLLAEQNLFDSNFSGAAVYGSCRVALDHLHSPHDPPHTRSVARSAQVASSPCKAGAPPRERESLAPSEKRGTPQHL
jgi:hypothetical protein